MITTALTFWPFPRVISHRGGGSLAPENTLAAIETGCKYGIPAVEFDVMLSRDKVPMLMHDEELTRTVMDTKYHGKLFNQYDAAELGSIDVGSYVSPDFSYVRIPTLESVLQHCLENHVFMNIEIKPAEGFDVRTGIIVAETVLQRYHEFVEIGVPPMFSSFSFDALKAAKEVAPQISRGFLIHEPLDTVDWKAQVRELGAMALHVNEEHLTRAQVAEIKEVGCGAFCYTVNDLARAEELLSWGVDCLCTDKIDTFSGLATKLRL